jgi:hypothetical protein
MFARRHEKLSKRKLFPYKTVVLTGLNLRFI